MQYHTTQSQDLLIVLDTICVCLQLVDDPIFIPIEQLEQKGGKPAEFSEVVREMKAGKTGHLRIKKARKGLGKVRWLWNGDVFFSFAYPFPDVAALTGLLYISRTSAIRSNLQTYCPKPADCVHVSGVNVFMNIIDKYACVSFAAIVTVYIKYIFIRFKD